MRLAVIQGRLALITERGAIDVATASEFPSDPQAVYDQWERFRAWYAANPDTLRTAEAAPCRADELDAPVPAPRQVFGIGMNYRAHAAEAGLSVPESDPVVFAKYVSSVAGPGAVVTLPSEAVDYEAELVVVMGKRAHRVSRDEAWNHVAGLTIGQDLSERLVQFRGQTPQFSLGKSFPGFSPTGPVLVTPDEFDDPDNIEIGCTLNGQQMQKGRTSDLIFTVPRLIESLSAIVALLPGDLIFTGTPAGIGWARDPKVVLRPGDRLVTHAEVIGELTTTFTAG
ncbi:MAG: fumarylacetoacetate hydrolase family protein [Streptosporangiales bacterium]|nr:fumarylacetoacetate hydrolase family protein [Streptosporangiales bacterium]